MAEQARLKGTFELMDTVTKKSPFSEPIEAIIAVVEYDSGKMIMDPSTTDEPLPMGGVTNGKVLYVSPSRSVDLKLNGALTPITLTKATAIFADFTGATFTTDADGPATIKYFVGGD